MNSEGKSILKNGNVPFKRKAISILMVVITSILYRAIYYLAPQFAITFHSFNTKLPAITYFFVSFSGVFLWISLASVAPASFLIVNLFSKQYVQRGLRVIKYNFYLAILCFVLFYVAMYLPIFQMGQVI